MEKEARNFTKLADAKNLGIWEEPIMKLMRQPGTAIFASGMIFMGILALIYGDFALVWQPVASWVPGRALLAYLSGIIMLAGGLGLLIENAAHWSVRILFAYLIIWLFLKVPALVVAPQIEGVWLGFGEIGVLLSGGWTIFAHLANLDERSPFRFLAGEQGIRAARIFFALSVIPIGLGHLFYVKETVALVPAWLPYRTGWALLTGLGQIACALGVLLKILPRLAAAIEAAMITLFAVLVWAPKVLAAPRDRFSWTAFLISWAIAAGAWVVALNIPSKEPSQQKQRTVSIA